MNFEIYCDESCPEVLSDKASHKFMGIGGIWIFSDMRTDLKESLNEIKSKHKIFGEAKWNKVTSKYLEFYKEIISYFFNADYIRFRVIIIESQKINTVKFNQDAELGFYKFYYQLIHNWILDNNNYEIFVDFKTTRDRTRLKVLKQVLKSSNLTSNIIQIQSLPSNESVGIQLADLLTGIVVAKFNQEITSNSKINLIKYIEESLNTPITHTSRDVEKFNIFRINLKGEW